jgi:CHAD domain-containing protein
MSTRTGPEDVIHRRLQMLARALPGAILGDATAVHKARVASRRVREALPVVLAGTPAKKRRKLAEEVQRVTRALGPVRELDVSLGVISELAAEHLDADGGLTVLRQHLEVQRQAYRERLVGKLEDYDVRRLTSRAERLLTKGRRVAQPDVNALAVLMVRLTRRAEELHTSIHDAGPMYAPEPIHAVRIATKKLRYAFELAHDLRLLSSRRALTRLKLTQETLGRLHDLQVIVQRLAVVQASMPRSNPAIDALTALAAILEDRCREQHARYLLQRERLLTAVDAALGDVTARAAQMSETDSPRVEIQ